MISNSSSSKRFNFYIMTNSRLDSTLRLLNQLSRFQSFGKVFISDSGSRSKEVFLENYKKIYDHNVDFNFIDNSNYRESPFLHWWSILDKGKENLFVFHDDDIINEKEFLKILNSNLTDRFNYICSTLKGKCSEFSLFEQKSDFERFSSIIKEYFLSPDDNCLLLTGLFIKKPYKLRKKIPSEFLIEGNYGDVAFMSWLFSQSDSFVSDLIYIQHIEHGENHNSSRSLYSRDLLHKFIFNRKSFEMKIISFLIYFNYPSRTHYFIAGLLLSSLAPSLWLKLSKKFLSVIKKTIF